MQKHRIQANLGKEQKIVVELNQDFGLLEILSLKLTQKDVYTTLCADYGVVCGRVSINNGFGLPNARVSIFVPLKDEDVDDPVISGLYPYQTTSDLSEDGFRYNLLPARKQHGGHEATGTFPDQLDILAREEVLEVYEKYYKYTVKTNTAGDFMIWGVPVGEQTIHVDVDLSDIGCFSLRPDDFLRKGYGIDEFKTAYQFTSSIDIDSLPQIKSFDRTIEVYPFWGSEDLCEIGITRTDFDLSHYGVKIEPKAYIIGGFFSDAEKSSINKNCIPRVKMGNKCDLVSPPATIESIRFTHRKDDKNRPILEYVDKNEDIDDTGAFVLPIEMNMDYVYTNEFGENEFSNDPNKGIPTSGIYRFRATVKNETLGRVRSTASYLIPNIKEYSDPTNTKHDSVDVRSYAWSTNFDNYPSNAINGILNVDDEGQYYPEDYFYRFTYNKVYTMSSFHNMYFQKDTPVKKNRFIGIKEISPSQEEDCTDSVNTFPVNFGVKNYTFTLLIADVLLFIEHLINLVTLTFINSVARSFFNLAKWTSFWPLRELSLFFNRVAYRIQENGQRSLYLINYPECEECNDENEDNENQYGQESGGDSSPKNDADIYCSIGTITVEPDYLTRGQICKVTGYDIGNVEPIGDCTKFTGSIDEFISLQTDYNLFENISPYHFSTELSSNQIYKSGTDYYFNDINGIFTVLYDDNITVANNIQFTILSNTELIDSESPPPGEGGGESSVLPAEEGCQLYDVPYDDDIIYGYYVTDVWDMYTMPLIPKNHKCKCTQTYNKQKIIATNICDRNCNKNIDHFDTKGQTTYYYESCKPNPVLLVPLVKKFENETFNLITKSGMSEFQNGIFKVVPATQTNRRLWEILREYRRRKRVGKMFCGGIVNYSFIDNWLSGCLYFFAFKSKNKKKDTVKYCTDVVTWVSDQERFYYRSCVYNPNDIDEKKWGHSYKPSNGAFFIRRINRPTTFVDLGPRDEFIKEICLDKTLDPNCSVARNIGPTSFQNFGELLGLAINYRMDISDNETDINDFFDNMGFKRSLGIKKAVDGDILQLVSINNEVGIEEFDLQNTRYLGYSYQYLDPEEYPQVFTGTTIINGKTYTGYGPLPITFYLSEDGERIRACLNEPTHVDFSGKTVDGRLTESSQKVPFYLWDKKGPGFGNYITDRDSIVGCDDQSWDYTVVQAQKLQGMTFSYNKPGYLVSPNDSSDQYLLLPITYDFSGYTFTGITGVTGNTMTDVPFDEIGDSTTGNQYDSHKSEYPGYQYLYVTVGDRFNPKEGILYTRVGAAKEGLLGWDIRPWKNTYYFMIRKTENYYNDTVNKNKQILSTPFLYYFGLRPGKTGLDKFIERFGPTGAFPPAED